MVKCLPGISEIVGLILNKQMEEVRMGSGGKEKKKDGANKEH